MLVSAFDYALDCTVPTGLATIGKFDGSHPAMACATTGGRVLIHQPYINKSDQKDLKPGFGGPEQQNEIQFLNTNKNINALSCGSLDPAKPEYDLLLIGSSTNLLVYDCCNNQDIFDKEVNDGLSSMAICSGEVLPDVGQPVVVVGGNCSITGFDFDGEERFWTVSGDNVGSLAFVDFDGDGVDQLLAGSDDFAIRVFKGEEIIHDITEKSKVTHLTRISGQTFGYALSNGAYGIYTNTKKHWKSKSKDLVTAICGCDLNLYGDNQRLMVVGFQSGVVEVRKDKSGDIVCSMKVGDGDAIAKIFYYDYRMSGTKQIVVVTSTGIIKGFSLSANKTVDYSNDAEIKQASEKQLDLNRKKIGLQNKLQQLKEKKEAIIKASKQKDSQPVPGASAVVNFPTADDVQIQQMPDMQQKASIIQFTINKPGWIIKSVILQNEQLFSEGGLYMEMPTISQNKIAIPLQSQKNTKQHIEVKIITGQAIDSSSFHVIQLQPVLFRRFQMFELVNNSAIKVDLSHYVASEMDMAIDPDLFESWVAQSFVMPKGMSTVQLIKTNGQEIQMKGVNIRDGKPMLIQLKNNQQSGTCKLRIFTNSLELASDIVQDLVANYLKVPELESRACFPSEMERLNESILKQIKESNQLKSHFAANISESIQNLKVSVVKAEASLIINDIVGMRRNYAMVQQENGTLVGEYIKRTNNHTDLVTTLKELNNMIRAASNLRIGQAQKKVVAESRDCIRKQTTEKIQQIFENGTAIQA